MDLLCERGSFRVLYYDSPCTVSDEDEGGGSGEHQPDYSGGVGLQL